MSNAMYRLNYGNGQVQNFSSKVAAFRELAALTQYKAFAFVERYVASESEWYRIVA